MANPGYGARFTQAEPTPASAPPLGIGALVAIAHGGLTGLSADDHPQYQQRVPLCVSTTTVGNVGAGEDDLMTYQVPAAQLSANGSRLWFRASGSIANNANAKRLRVRFGSALIFDTVANIPAGAAIDWVLTGEVLRKGAALQACDVVLATNNSTFSSWADIATATETLSTAITIKVTGEGVADNDLVQESFVIDYYREVL